MTIDVINKNKIKISLSEIEVFTLFGGYENIEYSKPKTKSALNTILNEISLNMNFEKDLEHILVEVVPEYAGGCIIYFSKINCKTGRKYKYSEKKIKHILEFFDFESLLLAVNELYKNPYAKTAESDLYKIGKRYRLVISCESSFKDKIAHIKEYNCVLKSAAYDLSITEEYGQKIFEKDAINKINLYFFKEP